MKITHATTLFVAGIVVFCALGVRTQDVHAQDSASGRRTSERISITPSVAVVEMDPPENLEGRMWMSRYRERLRLPETLELAVRRAATADDVFPGVDLDALIAAVSGRETISIEPSVHWITITVSTGPAELRAKVANVLARWLRDEVIDDSHRGLERLRAHFSERSVRLRGLVSATEIERRQVIERSGFSEVSLELEQDRLVGLREDLGSILNAIEIGSVDSPPSEVPGARAKKMTAKIAEVDQRLAGLQGLVQTITTLGAKIERLNDEEREVQAEVRELELVRLDAPRARIVHTASNPTR